MTLDDKVLPLNKIDPDCMTNQLTFYSIDELFSLYPTIKERGWTAEDFVIWIDQDIISGSYKDGQPDSVQVEKCSFEAFLAYHNKFLKTRVERVEKGLDRLKKFNPKEDS